MFDKSTMYQVGQQGAWSDGQVGQRRSFYGNICVIILSRFMTVTNSTYGS
jgi:hypothetical protein